MLVTLDEIRAAAGRIRGVARRTPVVEVAGDARRGGPASGAVALALKCESLQPMGAFKIRGACNMLAQLSPEAREAGVITYSSGNHGQAVALVAQRFGIPAVVVMPETTPRVKIEGVRRYGAEMIFAGTTSLHRRTRAEAEAAARGLTMVPPFDHPWIIAGAGTCGLEILEQHPQASTIYVPVGGGGLISGIATAVKQMRGGVRVVGVEPEGAPKVCASRAAGHVVTLERTSSIADGLMAVRAGDLTFEHIQAYVDDVITTPDAAIVAAVKWLFAEARIVAEPSGAAAVAGALHAGIEPGAGTVALISGGNVEPADFARYIS